MMWRAIILLLLFVGVYFTTERLVVYPLDPRHISPAEAGIPDITEMRFEKMVVWTSPAKPSKPTVLYLHGNAGHLSNRTKRFQALIRRGYGVIAPAYRGGSGSGGWPTEDGILKDIRGLYDALSSGRLTGTPIAPIIYGESIGAAVAIHLNASYGMAHDWLPPKATVLEAPFTSLHDVAAAMHPQLPLATGLMISRWNSIKYANHLRGPLLVLHGANDELIPLEMGRAIFEAADSPDKALYVVKDAGHINVWKADAQRRLYEFLARF